MTDTGTAPLVVKGLSKSYGGKAAIKSLDLDLRCGEIFGLLGPNGAGKTTTLEIIEGLRTGDSGSILYFGDSSGKMTDEVRSKIGVQLQATGFLPQLSVEETLRLFAGMYPHNRGLEEIERTFELDKIRSARVKTLSGGQKQRLALACAVIHDPLLVFLDEPTNGLDTQSRRALWELILMLRAEGKTIVLTTHYMHEAEALADRIAIMDSGEVKALGSPAELRGRFDQPDLESVFLALTSASEAGGGALRE
jgi:ABC-2 type transport system ATP-binding protein